PSRFAFNATATANRSTLSLHDALPIYAPSYVSPAYHLLEGFPFIQEPPSGDLQERVLIRLHDYDQCFQSVQLLQWNSQVKFNVTDRKSGSAGMPRPISYAVFCLKKKSG